MDPLQIASLTAGILLVLAAGGWFTRSVVREFGGRAAFEMWAFAFGVVAVCVAAAVLVSYGITGSLEW